MHHPYARPIPIPLRLQASNPPTEAEIISRQDAWCEWVRQHEYDPYRTDKTPILRAVPQWNDNGSQIPTEAQIHNLLVQYTKKMKPEDVPLIANNPDLQGYKVRKFSSSRFNFQYLLMKETPGKSDIPKENAEPIQVCKSTNEKLWPATKTKHSSYDRLIRIKMPWAPYYGVENEVANMLFAAQHSRIRVPDIYCFDSSGKNTLGLDLIVMERIPGLFGSEVIETTGGTGVRGEDRRIIRSVRAQFRDRTHNVSKRRFDTIGGLYCNWGSETPVNPVNGRRPPDFFVGPLVDPAFFGPMISMKGINAVAEEGMDVTLLWNLKFSRGPFRNTKSYLSSLINAHLLRDWSRCKPSNQLQQDTEGKVSIKMTTMSLAIALAEAIDLYTDMDATMKLPKGGTTKLSTPYLFAPRFSPADLRPGSIVLTEQGSICTSTPRGSPVRESKSWKWYRLRAVTEWDTARVMPYVLSRHALRNGFADLEQGADTDRPSTSVHMLSRLSLDGVHDWDVKDDNSMECVRRLRGLEREIGWLCTVEMPKLQNDDPLFI